MRPSLTPVVAVDRDDARYVRAFLRLRVLVGALGLALPFALVLIDGVWLDGPFLRGSLSAYYYSGAREVFVGALTAIGVFLIAYKVAEVNLDNTLSVVAGAAVVCVALFPTSSARAALTPLQEEMGETFVSTIHYGAAAVFISSLAVISYFYGKREGQREPRPGQRRSPRFWRTFHWACAAAIAAALAFILFTEIFDVGPRRSLLYGEVASVWAFAISWLWKGLEVDMLRGRHGR